MIEPNDPRRLAFEAVERAASTPPVWNPVNAWVYNAKNEKVGRVISNGYAHKCWTFYPVASYRRSKQAVIPIDYDRRRIDINAAVPTWASPFHFGQFQTQSELAALVD